MQVDVEETSLLQLSARVEATGSDEVQAEAVDTVAGHFAEGRRLLEGEVSVQQAEAPVEACQGRDL